MYPKINKLEEYIFTNRVPSIETCIEENNFIGHSKSISRYSAVLVAVFEKCPKNVIKT